ncbi:MAG: helix-turn-helix domain-containing protein [Erythrobacter sp.]|uniref:helix-turn-helix domain-containing protein n=1 Tax=Erythrobacter sp. TaxID=1042 RepID=UPI003A8B7D76
MAQELLSAEQVAEMLGLHVRTVRNYVREGKLNAVRIGKQYRIAYADVEAFTGHAAKLPSDHVRRRRHVEVSSIVEIDAVDPETASRLATALTGAAQGRQKGGVEEQLRVNAIHYPERARLKVIVTGGVTATSQLLGLVDLVLER